MEKLRNLLNIINESHGWKDRHIKRKESNFKGFKYVNFQVNFCMDTRDMQIWTITFRQGNDKKSFRLEQEEDFDELVKWLDSDGGM